MVSLHRLASLLLLLSALASGWGVVGESVRPAQDPGLATIGALFADEITPPLPVEPGGPNGGFTLEIGNGFGVAAPLRTSDSIEIAAPAEFAGRCEWPVNCRPIAETLPYYSTAPPAG